MIAGLLPAVGVAASEDDALLLEKDGAIVISNTHTPPDLRPRARRVPPGERPLPASAFDEYIELAANEHGLPPTLVKAVAITESNLDPMAVSSKGARGLMQLMPATARQYGVRDSFDPLQNLRAGAQHLRGLLDQYDGDLPLALAAYNAGSEAVRRYGGIPDYRETRNYVRKVHEALGRPLPAKGKRPPLPVGEPVRMEVGVDGSVSLVN